MDIIIWSDTFGIKLLPQDSPEVSPFSAAGSRLYSNYIGQVSECECDRITLFTQRTNELLKFQLVSELLDELVH